MAMNVKLFGGINVVEQPEATGLPQEAVTAWDSVNLGELVGANYKVISYIGNQLAQGVNHFFLVQQTIVLAEPVRHIAVVTINEFAGNYSVTNIERLY